MALNRWRSRLATLLVVLLLGGSLLALRAAAESAGEPASLSNPDQLAFLRRQLAEFNALPGPRQEQIRRLHRQLTQRLSQQPPEAARLTYRVLRDYHDWLAALPEAERKTVLDASNSEKRLAIVRRLREQQQLARLPRRLRETLEAKPEDERRKELRRWQGEHRRPSAGSTLLTPPTPRWDERLPALPAPFDRPVPRAELSAFIERVLRPMLTPEEDERLWLAVWNSGEHGHDFLSTLVELADKHPVYPTNPEHLPQAWGKDLPMRLRRHLRDERGKYHWPELALQLVQTAHAEKIPLPFPLGAATLTQFPDEIRDSIRAHLSEMQLRTLKEFEGRWPEYPQRLVALAREQDVSIRGLMLPGKPSFWKAYRPEPSATPG